MRKLIFKSNYVIARQAWREKCETLQATNELEKASATDLIIVAKNGDEYWYRVITAELRGLEQIMGLRGFDVDINDTLRQLKHLENYIRSFKELKL